jgi:hypothetical protein
MRGGRISRTFSSMLLQSDINGGENKEHAISVTVYGSMQDDRELVLGKCVVQSVVLSEGVIEGLTTLHFSSYSA